MNQRNTPLFDALVKFHGQAPLSLHVPGHKSGLVFPEEASAFYQSLLKLDVTELTGLDDLHSPEGVIREAESLLTELYKTKQSFFLINGSTVGNLTMILSSFREGDMVFVQRNCHKSILNGLKLAKLTPIFIEPDFNTDWKVTAGLGKASIESAYESFPKAKGLILTYPNYYGHTYDLQDIIQCCHQRDMLVLVDEAHGAHFIAGEPFPPSALVMGADLVVQSAHKTLPAMTMSAFLHINSERVSMEAVKQYLQMLQSSSPSYPLMASLDISRHYLATYSEEDKKYLTEQLSLFLSELEKIPSLKVFCHRLEGDPLKIVIQSRIGVSGFELQQVLEVEGIYTELADSYNVLFVFPLLKKGIDYPIMDLIDKIKKAMLNIQPKQNKIPIFSNHSNPPYSCLGINYQEQKHAVKRIIEFENSIGMCSAEMVIPYPPGVPLVMEGERITKKMIEQLTWLRQLGARFHGGDFLAENKLQVFI